VPRGKGAQGGRRQAPPVGVERASRHRPAVLPLGETDPLGAAQGPRPAEGPPTPCAPRTAPQPLHALPLLATQRRNEGPVSPRRLRRRRPTSPLVAGLGLPQRSEERRGGKEGR